MNVRSQARAFLMQAANISGVESLAFLLQRRKTHSRGLVVAMHETPASLEAQLRKQLEFASQHFAITSLEGFAKIWNEDSEPASSKPFLLFTFDDGRESNYAVAAPLLESFGARGLFFVVPAFAESGATEKALSFYRTKVNRNSRNGDEQLEDWKPMSPAQIADLASRGHAIGNHTLTHERLVGLSPEMLEREIGESARQLASWAQKPIDAFAWTFGWDAIDLNAWKVIQRYHRFCFSPCAGAINPYRDRPSLLWRREIEARYCAPEYRFCYSGLIDLWWSTRRAHLREIVRSASARNAE